MVACCSKVPPLLGSYPALNQLPPRTRLRLFSISHVRAMQRPCSSLRRLLPQLCSRYWIASRLVYGPFSIKVETSTSTIWLPRANVPMLYVGETRTTTLVCDSSRTNWIPWPAIAPCVVLLSLVGSSVKPNVAEYKVSSSSSANPLMHDGQISPSI